VRGSAGREIAKGGEATLETSARQKKRKSGATRCPLRSRVGERCGSEKTARRKWSEGKCLKATILNSKGLKRKGDITRQR